MIEERISLQGFFHCVFVRAVISKLCVLFVAVKFPLLLLFAFCRK